MIFNFVLAISIALFNYFLFSKFLAFQKKTKKINTNYSVQHILELVSFRNTTSPEIILNEHSNKNAYSVSLNQIHLSNDVFRSQSVTSIAIALHEYGHFLHRSWIKRFEYIKQSVLYVRFYLAIVILFIILISALVGNGFTLTLFAKLFLLLTLGIYTLETLCTLGFEYDASRRAITLSKTRHIFSQKNMKVASYSLFLAWLTYFLDSISLSFLTLGLYQLLSVAQ